MWKKGLFCIITIMITFSIAYAYDNNLSATTNKYNVGGDVTGRINMAPKDSNGKVMTGDNFGLQAGDHVMIGGDNPYTGNPLSFQLLLYDENYTDYNNTDVINEVREPISSWLTASDEVLTELFQNIDPESVFDKFIGTDENGYDTYIPSNFSRTVLGQKLTEINSIPFNSSLLAPRDLAELRACVKAAADGDSSKKLRAELADLLLRNVGNHHLFIPGDASLLWSSSDWSYPKPANPVYNDSFSWVHMQLKPYLENNTDSIANSVWRLGSAKKVTNSTSSIFCYTYTKDGAASGTTCNKNLSIRAFAHLDLSKIVFSVSEPKKSGIRSTVDDTFVVSPSVAYYSQGGETMKLRMYDPNIDVTFDKIMTKKGKEITQIPTGLPVYFNASGTEGDKHTISALIFDKDNHFIGYQPLDDANAELTAYKFDTINLKEGTYKIALVNEIYDETSTDPTYSSKLTNVKTLQITDPDFYVVPKEDLEYKKNVNQGNTVADIIVKDGVSYGSFQLVSDTAETGHANDYQLFEIKDKTITVKNANGLDAGDYYFKLKVLDDSGSAMSGIDLIPVCIEVAKTDLKVAFDNPSETKKSTIEAATAWNETASATPNTGVKVTYSVTKGSNIVSVNASTGAITYKGNHVYGKVTIKAVADDDPTTSKDNYNSAETEKSIIIYRGVNVKFSPDSASSSTSSPTFTANQANVQANGLIGKVIGSEGTPDDIDGTAITYTYSLVNGEDSASFAIDASSGQVSANTKLGVGTYHFTAKVKDSWSEKTVAVTVIVKEEAAETLKFYENSTSDVVITSKTVKATDTNVSVFATVKGSSNNNPVTYKIKDGSANVITINSDNGAIIIKGVGTVTIVAEKAGAQGQANTSAELTFTVTSGEQDFIYTDSGGNELPKTADKYNAYEEVYKKDKTFQLYTALHSKNRSTNEVTYKLKSGSPTDVITVDEKTGLVHILNASLNTQMGKVIVQATSHDPSGNYSDSTIELPINIKKAEQTISFADVTYATSGKGKVTPVINEQDISSNDGGVSVNDTDYYITIDSSIATSIAWTNNGVDIEYNYSGKGLDIPLHVEKAGNRNYNKATADGSMHIMGPDENTLAINRPGKIVYGDHFTIKSLQDDSSSTNVQYTFTVDNNTYISNPSVNGNKAEFDALKYSGSTNITITVTRTADGETDLSKTITIQVLPKEIDIVIDDKEKYKGEENPLLTYQDFKNQLVSWNGNQDVIQANDIKLSTTAKKDSPAGNYPIKGDSGSLNKTYPNYRFTFQEGTLKVTEDVIEDDWYHLEIDDENKTAYHGEWTNQAVNIVSDHNEYKHMSLDQSTWKEHYVTVTKEGETNQSFWMKKDDGAVTKEKQEIIRIDQTAPKVIGIKAKDTNNKLQNSLNKLTGGIFFKPGTVFEILSDDSKEELKVSGTKEISYKLYQITDEKEEEIKNGILKVHNEKASITINETVGKYKVCVIPTDNAGNTNKESCHMIELKKINVDVDGDGKPDFNDPDGDGCPDLNIKWKDPDNPDEWSVMNGDRDGDGIPDLNIDSDGDGIPDLNVDTDKDGRPDLNLVILKKGDWKPTKCVKVDTEKGIFEEYCTGTSVKAVINVDLDGDKIPDINIDNIGDFKPHINISKDGKTPMINITILHDWKPIKNYQANNFLYDSIGKDGAKPELNIDTDGDGRPDINLDLNGDGIPDLNIDWNGDLIPDTQIDSTGDGKPDINIDHDGNGIPDENIVEIKEWKPNKNVDGDLPYDTMEFDDPNDPSEPEEPKNPDDPHDPVDSKEPSDEGNDTDVKGYYYPGNSFGGAMTGDTSNMMLLFGLLLISLGTSGYMLYKIKKDTFQ